jgi:hypothetical protein
VVLAGEVETDAGKARGCRFAPRCAFAMDVCRQVDPPPFAGQGGTTVRCHLHTTGPRLDGRTVLSLTPSETAAP